MKKITLLILSLCFIVACKNDHAIEKTESETATPEMSKSESDQKLIDVCESMDGVAQADVKDDILTVRANISKIEAKKLSDGMLSEIKKYRQDINTVIVCDLKFRVLSYSGK